MEKIIMRILGWWNVKIDIDDSLSRFVPSFKKASFLVCSIMKSYRND